MDMHEVLKALKQKEISPEDAMKILNENKNEKSDKFVDIDIHSKDNLQGTGNKAACEKSSEHVAIIGVSGRYPGAKDLKGYWNNLTMGKNSIQKIPKSRWDVDRYFDPRPSQKGKIYSKWLGILDDIDYFDPMFFNIPPVESDVMDPQHRIFLQEAYKAFEDAGYSSMELNNKKCGVYLGMMSNDYSMMLLKNNTEITNSTGNSYAIAAARISYYLNLKGPAITIDTACSSSLVATHLACQSLWNHEIDMALVGGVSLYLSPELYLAMCATGMLSPDGQCKSFDNGANGFVPGEGAGALVLKRLKDAEADNDHIYGVIIGSGINQDGKTNGITAPSVSSQIELEREVYERFKISPDSISYIEAHGTGTKLGDPIEVEALSTVFREKTSRRNFCALGSVKSNIGHTSAAAGIASIHKILMSIRNKMMVPTLNYKIPNEHFSMEDSPFYINTQLKAWETALGVPRRAGVSAFGFSGTNAHIVIEEYIPKSSETAKLFPVSNTNPALFVLSAKSEEQLKTYAKSIESYLISNEKANLRDATYTLQVGRDAMDYRLAFSADGREEALDSLRGFINGKLSQDIFYGHIKKSKNSSTFLQDIIEDRDLKELAEQWVNGQNVDWNQLYKDIKPKRISLPTYPFAEERYWIPESIDNIEDASEQSAGVIPFINPLLHMNTSDFLEQKFSSCFSGKEFFLADHIVKGKRVLPGVAYLEMARSAAEQAVRASRKGDEMTVLKDVVWIRPFSVGNEPEQINIGLCAEENGEITYKVYCDGEEPNTDTIVFNQGTVEFVPIRETSVLNIKEIQAQCAKFTISSEQCYDMYQLAGIDYGWGHKGVENIYVGENQVLAKLSLPESVLGTKEQYILHPCLMDSALQASVGLLINPADENILSKENVKLSLPFELSELEVYSKCTSNMWSYVKLNSSSGKVQKFDIDICDAIGNLCVKIKGYSTRVHEGDIQVNTLNTDRAEVQKSIPFGNLLLHPVWESAIPEETQHFPPETSDLLVIGGKPEIMNKIRQLYPKAHQLNIQAHDSIEEIAQKLKAKGEVGHILWIVEKKSWIVPEEEALLEEQYEELLKCFRAIKALILLGYGDRELEWSIVTGNAQNILENDTVNPCHASVLGLFGSMAKEYQNWRARLIDIEGGYEFPVEKIFRLPVDKQGRVWGYRNSQWYRQYLIPFSKPVQVEESFKQGGVYVVIGGAGNIGEAWSEYMIRTYQAKIVWIGRRKIDDKIQKKLDRLSAIGPVPLYISADATSLGDLQRVYKEIKKSYKQINGIVQSAIVLSDKSLESIEEDEFRSVLSAKIDVSIRMAQVFGREPLDFVLFFSSIMAFIKAPNQSDYASGCMYKDAFAHSLNQLFPCKVKVMNWGYWSDKGHLSTKYYKSMEKNFRRLEEIGIGLIEYKEAMEALEALFSVPLKQIAFMKTTKPIVIEGMKVNDEAVSINTSQKKKKTESIKETLTKNSVEKLKERCTRYFKNLICTTLKMPEDRMDTSEPLEKYGVDSIVIVRLTNRLHEVIDGINSTVFFEYPSIDLLVEYLMETQKDSLIKLVGSEYGKTNDSTPACFEQNKMSKRFITTQDTKTRYRVQEQTQEPIAVIGLTGKYPKSKGIGEFWMNLKAGTDCVIEIPKDRWDVEDFFLPNKQEAAFSGKSYSKWGGFIDDVDMFDPLFFNISPKDAEIMDPQERLFMECVWNLFENVGYTRETIKNIYKSRVGVFAGAMYQQYHAFDSTLLKESAVSLASFSSIANRVSYYFDFRGPSIAVDTACSSSALAIHMACESLRKGECELAVAGGVNLSIHPKKYIGLCQAQIIGSSKNSRSFGQGDGYIPAEGIGAVLLKPLSKAEEANDNILAVIMSTTTNHGGRSNGYALPNVHAQAELIEENINKSGIDPRTISYVEAAANGSSLGDPVEVSALNKVFQKYTRERQFCAIGTVKSNIGHAEAASGISQLTKVILQLQHKQITPTILAEPMNSDINFDNTAFYLQKNLTQWERPVIEIENKKVEFPRRAAINSFGAGGSNVHLIIEEYDSFRKQEDADRASITPQIIVFSAKNQSRLKAVVKQMLEFIKSEKPSLQDLAYTLQIGREAMETRVSMVVSDIGELVVTLEKFLGVSGCNIEAKGIVPIFTGDIEDEDFITEGLELRKMDESELQDLISQNNIEKVAYFWAKGRSIPWDLLYNGKKVRKLLLPTYPFSRERFWIEKDIVENRESCGDSEFGKNEFCAESKGNLQEVIQNYIMDFISTELRITRSHIKLNKNIQEFGTESITYMRLIRGLEKSFNAKITLREILENPSVKLLSAYIVSQTSKLDGEIYRDTDSKTDENGFNVLEKFKSGELSLEELENLIDKGVII